MSDLPPDRLTPEQMAALMAADWPPQARARKAARAARLAADLELAAALGGIAAAGRPRHRSHHKPLGRHLTGRV